MISRKHWSPGSDVSVQSVERRHSGGWTVSGSLTPNGTCPDCGLQSRRRHGWRRRRLQDYPAHGDGVTRARGARMMREVSRSRSLSTSVTLNLLLFVLHVADKSVGLRLPSRALPSEPSFGLRDRPPFQHADAHPSLLLGPDHAAAFQHPNMLHEGRQAHLERLGQFAHAGRSLTEPADHCPPGRIRQGKEDAVERLCRWPRPARHRGPPAAGSKVRSVMPRT